MFAIEQRSKKTGRLFGYVMTGNSAGASPGLGRKFLTRQGAEFFLETEVLDDMPTGFFYEVVDLEAPGPAQPAQLNMM